MNITRHAYKRMSERRIHKDFIGLALDFGSESGNGEKIILDKKTISSMISSLNDLRKTLEKLQSRGGLTVVALQEKVITSYYNNSYISKGRITR